MSGVAAESVYVTDLKYGSENVGGVWTSTIQVFGRRESGESVLINVYGFPAYFYCRAPDGVNPAAVSAELTPCLQGLLSKKAGEMKRRGGYNVWRSKCMQTVLLQTHHVRRTGTMGHQEEGDMIQVVCSHPMAVAPLRDAIVTGRGIAIVVAKSVVRIPQHAFEANLDYVLRYMVDTGVRSGAWIRVTAAKEATSDSSCCTSPDLTCSNPSQIYVYTDAEEREHGFVPSLKLLSFDIECAAAKGTFPDPELDPVIQIACDVVRMDGRSTADIEKDKAEAGKDVDVRCFNDESRLLVAFAGFIRHECDPDIITSWNGLNFDWKYIIDRAKFLNCPKDATRFSRLRYHQTRNRVVVRTTKAYGNTEDNEVVIPGRVMLDMLVPVKKQEKLRSYKLNDVAEEFLGERKDPIKHTEITEMWRADAIQRGKLLHYCVQDARLPRRLLLKLQMATKFVEIARVCRVPLNYLVTKGEGIKVFTQLCYEAKQHGFVVDYIPHEDNNGGVVSTLRKEADYKGATVLEPERGFYKTPIATLDFASLYPSIMIANNLCYTTWVPKDRVKDYAPEDVETSPSGDTFVKAHVRQGLLPRILTQLGNARTAAKELKAQALEVGDLVKASVYDKRQLALKISANSVYGFTGAEFGKLPLKPIARSVTAYGRQMIDITKAEVERVGPPGTKVIYGDTDSVMIMYPCSIPAGPDGKLTDVKAAITESRAYALLGAEAVNKLFPFPVSLEYEKVFYPYLLISKKRYAGGYFEKPAVERMFVKAMGIESQRRDNCKMLPRILDELLTCLMDDLSPERAIATAQDAVQAIVDGPIDPQGILYACAVNARVAVARVVGISKARVFADALAGMLNESYKAEFDKGATPHTLKKDWCALAERAALEYVDESVVGVARLAIEDALRRNVTVDDHVMSKAFSRPVDKYADIMSHIEVIKNMRKRDDEIAAGYQRWLGDRIEYIVIAPCKKRPDTADGWTEVTDRIKTRACIPIGLEKTEKFEIDDKTEEVEDDDDEPKMVTVVTRTMRGRDKTTVVHGGANRDRDWYAQRYRRESVKDRTIMGKKKTTKRTADRAEDPEWAVANGHVPDALYCVEKQLIKPCSRLLKPLLGTKEEAVRQMLDPVKRRVVPERGFWPSRFDSKTRNIIQGRETRPPTPAKQEETAKKAWVKENGASAAKRTRTTGPLDKFFSCS